MKIATLIGGTAFALSMSGALANSFYLSISGVEGNAALAKPPADAPSGLFGINTFAWGVTNAVSTGVGGGGSAGKASGAKLSWSQSLGTSFIDLLKDSVSGKHVPEANLYILGAGEAKNTPLFEMSFNDVIISSLQLNGANGAAAVTGAFAWNVVTIKQWTQNPDGSIGDPRSATWNLSKNTITGNSDVLASFLAFEAAAPVPEPETWALMGLGAVALTARQWRRRKALTA